MVQPEISQVSPSQGQCKFGYVEFGSDGIDAFLSNLFCLSRSLIIFSQPSNFFKKDEKRNIKENIEGE